MGTPVHVEARGQHQVFSSIAATIFIYLFIKTWSLTELKERPFVYSEWPVSSGDLPVSAPPLSIQGLQTCTVAPTLYVGLGIRTQVLTFMQQILYLISHLPSPHLSYDGNLSVAPRVSEGG